MYTKSPAQALTLECAVHLGNNADTESQARQPMG